MGRTNTCTHKHTKRRNNMWLQTGSQFKKSTRKDKESNNNKKNKDKEVRQDSSPSNDNYHMFKCTGNILSPAHSCELSKPHIELCTPFKRQIRKLVFQIQRKA